MRMLLCITVLGSFIACAKPHTGTTSATPIEVTAIAAHRLSDADVAQERAAGTNVDTIVVKPDHITLRVGESAVLWLVIATRALDANGAVVAPFNHTYIIPPSSFFRADGPTILGLAPGEGVIYVEALPRTTQARTRPSTAVRVIVVP